MLSLAPLDRATLPARRRFKPRSCSNPPHGVMDRPKLLLELRDQVQLMRDEDLGIRFKGFELPCPMVRHTPRS